MVDKLNPTNQFHPYHPETSTPVSERNAGGFGGFGSVLDSVKNVDVNQSIGKARSWAPANPSKVLGGLAALAIGAGLMRKRM